MIAQSDPAVVSATLSAAGLGDIRIDAAEETFAIGRTREAALSDVRDGLADHHEQSGVRLGGGIWLISATR